VVAGTLVADLSRDVRDEPRGFRGHVAGVTVSTQAWPLSQGSNEVECGAWDSVTGFGQM
jgi:hypothetical protein